jgi:hypothetical protein
MQASGSVCTIVVSRVSLNNPSKLPLSNVSLLQFQIPSISVLIAGANIMPEFLEREEKQNVRVSILSDGTPRRKGYCMANLLEYPT